MPASKPYKGHKSIPPQGQKGGQGHSPKGTNRDFPSNKGKNEQESVDAEEIHEWNESDLAAEEDHIEADGEVDIEYNITDMEAEEDLEAELCGEGNGLNQRQSQQEHKKDEHAKAGQSSLATKARKAASPPHPSEEDKPKKFVIPKIKTASTEKQSSEIRRSKDSSLAHGNKDGGRTKQAEKQETSLEDTIMLDEDNQDFQAEVEDDVDSKAEEETAVKEETQNSEKTSSEQRMEGNLPLEIPEGKDSVMHLREQYPWQIRMYPVKRADVTKPDFGKIWSMAQSSLITWTTHGDANGVAEFLLEDKAGIQMFMRKLMWFTFSTRYIIVEVVERSDSKAEDGTTDPIHNTAIFRYDNHTARKLIKTYYPTAAGEVTERSLYVNNVGMGVSADIMKAIFPCALKIGVAKASKDTSSALVQTESEEAAFNYLVVYHRVSVNGLDLELSTIKHDWQGARNKYFKTETGKTPEGEKPLFTSPSKPDDSRKRRTSSPNTTQSVKKERKVESAASTRGRGRALATSAPRGRGRALSKSAGIGLLPRPDAKGKGLLPLPLMSVPVPKPSPVDEFLLAQERGRRLAELEEARHQEAETRAAYPLVTRRPEAGDQIADRFSLMERMHRAAAPAPRSFPRSLDYEDEEESVRRPMRVREEYGEREDWMRETAGYQRPRPLVDDFESKPYHSERQEETLLPRRLAAAPARPYLLEVPEEKDRYTDRAETEPYYGGSSGASRSARLDPEPRRTLAEERRTLLGRGGLLDIRDRYPLEEERVAPRSRDLVEYHREQGQLGSLYSSASSLDAHEDARRSHLPPRYPAERHGSAAYGFESRY